MVQKVQEFSTAHNEFRRSYTSYEIMHTFLNVLILPGPPYLNGFLWCNCVHLQYTLIITLNTNTQAKSDTIVYIHTHIHICINSDSDSFYSLHLLSWSKHAYTHCSINNLPLATDELTETTVEY